MAVLEGKNQNLLNFSFNNSEINISGGTFDASGGQVFLSSSTVLNINGSLATLITMDRLNLTAAGREATINFNFDAAGVSTIENAAFLGLSLATLNIDGSAYTGPGGVFNLLTSGNLTSGLAFVALGMAVCRRSRR